MVNMSAPVWRRACSATPLCLLEVENHYGWLQRHPVEWKELERVAVSKLKERYEIGKILLLSYK